MQQQKSEDELQISEFIKEPASLKLLILAGTNIRPTQLHTVNKCSSLIKLDLSGNQLSDLPLQFNNFPHLRILYLHDNQLTTLTLAHTHLEYVSLFDNPITRYRSTLIQNNPKLMAIDFHIVSKTERALGHHPAPSTQLKWPIVEISQPLQQEEDYLNLLKAELFVIAQVYRRNLFTQTIARSFRGFLQVTEYEKDRLSVHSKATLEEDDLKAMAKHWMSVTEKRKKVRKFLEGTKDQQLLMNRWERIRKTRSPGVNAVITKFVQSVKQRMMARRVLSRELVNYRLSIPAWHDVEQDLLESPLKLYFKQSQLYLLDKILLFSKKTFFNEKNYDICDNFDKLVLPSRRSYYIFRSTKRERNTFMMQMVANSMGLVVGEWGLDRRAFLYNRRGHRQIQIKRVSKTLPKYDQNKLQMAAERLDRMYDRYDKLLEYEFQNELVFRNVVKLIRYFNSGNGGIIMNTQAAYFQTEVVLEDKEEKKQRQEPLFVSSYQVMRRVLAANVIQKWWRKKMTVKKQKNNVLHEIKKGRAEKLIGRWLRDLRFRHRLKLSKQHSFLKTAIREVELCMQLQIYLSLPFATNRLNINFKDEPEVSDLYRVLHTQTQIERVECNGRSWIKFRFLTAQDAYRVQKLLSVCTYRFYFNGTFLKLFSLQQLHNTAELEAYEHAVSKLFKVNIEVREELMGKTVKKIEVDNLQSYFIWPLVEEGFGSMFKRQEIYSLPISVFIYNKNKRPLKVNCDLMWTHPATLYHYRKRVKPLVRVHTPKKPKEVTDPPYDIQLPHIRHKLNRSRQLSMKQHRSLLSTTRKNRGNSEYVNQLSLLSETLNIKRT